MTSVTAWELLSSVLEQVGTCEHGLGLFLTFDAGMSMDKEPDDQPSRRKAEVTCFWSCETFNMQRVLIPFDDSNA
jgi:hypothetical protein